MLIASGVDPDSTSYALGEWTARLGVLGLGIGLLIYGIHVRTSTDKNRGEGFIAGGAIALILGLASTALGLTGRDDPHPGKVDDHLTGKYVRSHQAVKDPGPAVAYDSCDQALVAVRKVVSQVMTAASQGHIDRLRTLVVYEPRVVFANKRCFSADVVAGMRNTAKAKNSEPDGIDRVEPKCRKTIRDVYYLLNFAAGMRPGSVSMSDEAARGFEQLRRAEPDCMTTGDVHTMKKKLADSSHS
jgi:hypothetical protein